MKLTVIGKYGPYPSQNGRTSCYLLQSGPVSVALDFGSGAIAGIQKYIPLSGLHAVICSHLHYDHASDLLPFSYYASANSVRPKLLCPFDESLLFKMLSADNLFALEKIRQTPEAYAIGDFQFRFLRMPHSAESYAMRITDGKKILIYTGDCSSFDETWIPFCKNADIVLMDTCGGAQHCSVLDAEKFAHALPDCRIIATHLHPSANYRTTHPRIIFAEEDKTYNI